MKVEEDGKMEAAKGVSAPSGPSKTDSGGDGGGLSATGKSSKRIRKTHSEAAQKSAEGREDREESVSEAEYTSSSDGDTDDDRDELQFVGGANSVDGGDSDAEDSSSEAEKEVEASFELFDPQDEDAACVLLLLRHSRMYSQLGLQPQDLRALAEVIAGQGNIGSIARPTTGAEGSRTEAAVGMVTLISAGQYPKPTEPLVKKIVSLAETHAPGKTAADLGELLCVKGNSRDSKTASSAKGGHTERNLCFFISCRFTNLPLEVTAGAVESLAEDVKWSLETPEMEEEERPWYRFSHVVGMTLIYRETKAEDAQKKQKHILGLDFAPTFAEVEHEVLSGGATIAFAAPTNQTLRFSSLPTAQSKANSTSRKRVSVMRTMHEYLLVYVVPYQRFEQNQRKVKQRLVLEGAVRCG